MASAPTTTMVVEADEPRIAGGRPVAGVGYRQTDLREWDSLANHRKRIVKVRDDHSDKLVLQGVACGWIRLFY